jgi:hypothetical protein
VWEVRLAPTLPGDSGGPWYFRFADGAVRAAGVTYGTNTTTLLTYFTHIYYALTQTSSSLFVCSC